ncbi:hypothetical protein [Paraconexibacter sp. AEG42_29]|uniref:hypothetical protein n=1 Tax=Paraconexibacter sp. AEG42_29 TaxID=2997339 RepID=UPI00339D92F5
MDEDSLRRALTDVAPTVPRGIGDDLALATTVSGPRSVPAKELLHTYSVRHARWREEGVPPCAGFDAFIGVLRSRHAAPVRLAGFHTARNSWTVLLDPVADQVIAAVRIDVPPRERPTDQASLAAIARGEYLPRE